MTEGLPTGPGGALAGASAVFSGLRRVMTEPPLRRLAVVPIAITALFYVAAIVALLLWTDDALAWLWPRPESWSTRWLWYLALPVAILLIVVVMALLFGTIAEVIGSPFYDRMAIRVLEGHGVTARDPGLFAGTLPDLLRSLFFVTVAAACALLGFIPGVGALFALLGTAIAWVGLAAAAVNPALLCTGHGLRARLAFIARSRSALLGMGAVIGTSFLVPLAGLVVLPAAVVGATDLYARSLRGE